MKFLTLMLFILLSNVSFAQQNVVVSNNQPNFNTGVGSALFAGQAADVWLSGLLLSCSLGGDFNHEVDYKGQVIDVFFQAEGSLCVTPPIAAYLQVAQLRGLEAGDYTLNFYRVPRGDHFPPAAADVPGYFFESINFGVMPTVSVDATSDIALMLMVILVLAFSAYRLKTGKSSLNG